MDITSSTNRIANSLSNPSADLAARNRKSAERTVSPASCKKPAASPHKRHASVLALASLPTDYT